MFGSILVLWPLGGIENDIVGANILGAVYYGSAAMVVGPKRWKHYRPAAHRFHCMILKFELSRTALDDVVEVKLNS